MHLYKSTMTANNLTLRTLIGADFEKVIELDRINSGTSRRGFFEKRQRAMEHNPEVFIGLAARVDEELVGFIMATILNGEFGGSRRVAVLDALGVDPARRRIGVGHELLGELIAEIKQRGGHELRTQVEWNQPGLMDFFSSVGFSLAPRIVLERSTEEIPSF